MLITKGARVIPPQLSLASSNLTRPSRRPQDIEGLLDESSGVELKYSASMYQNINSIGTSTAQGALFLNERFDIDALSKRFQTRGRIHIKNIFRPDVSARISTCLHEGVKWNLVTNNNGKHLDLDATGMTAISNDNRQRFFKAVHNQAQRDFQYLYKNYPIYDAFYNGTEPENFLNTVFEFINGPEFLGLVRRITGDHTIAFADAQATCYESGHFLTCHDDNVAGKNRCCAYVLNFTKDWRADWGGLLQFIGKDEHVEEAFVPAFNALNIFRVPQRHSVSIVTPFAGAQRLSITGWLRSGADPLRKQPQKSKLMEAFAS